jgi:hypothetical protein
MQEVQAITSDDRVALTELAVIMLEKLDEIPEENVF